MNEIANDNKYTLSNDSCINMGVISQKWYYTQLDKKGKRPTYQKIQAMGILAPLFTQADDNGYIQGEFELQEGKKGGLLFDTEMIENILNDLEIDSNPFCYPVYFFCVNNLTHELRFLAGHLIQKIMTDWMNSACDENHLEQKDEFIEWYRKNKDLYTIAVNKNNLCEFFNETPQRIRKGLELLSRLNLITLRNKESVSLNNNLIGSILEREGIEMFGGQNE